MTGVVCRRGRPTWLPQYFSCGDFFNYHFDSPGLLLKRRSMRSNNGRGKNLCYCGNTLCMHYCDGWVEQHQTLVWSNVFSVNPWSQSLMKTTGQGVQTIKTRPTSFSGGIYLLCELLMKSCVHLAVKKEKKRSRIRNDRIYTIWIINNSYANLSSDLASNNTSLLYIFRRHKWTFVDYWRKNLSRVPYIKILNN